MEPWTELSEGHALLCNRDRDGIGWRFPAGTSGCGRPAAYQQVLPGGEVLRNCLEHHREFLRAMEMVGKIEWRPELLPDGGVRFVRHDPYAE